MPRHHSILVHKQISAQLAGGLLKRAPRGYPALVSYPPHPTPPQDPHGNSHHRKRKLAPIRFEAKDRLRRAFFRDHPFEAYRPVSLLELDPRLLLHKATRDLSNCHRLDQISCRPSPEDCIDFAERLYLDKGYNLNQAYKISVSEFRTLRFEEQIRASFARQEAEYYNKPLEAGVTDEQEEEREVDGQNILHSSTDPEELWGRNLAKRSLEIQDRFIVQSNAKSTRRSGDKSLARSSSSPSLSSTKPPPAGDHSLPDTNSNRLIGSRIRNSAHLSLVDQPALFNQAINSELLKKSKRPHALGQST